MARVFIERRELDKNIALTWDIAHHMYVRAESGTVVVVAESPTVVLATLRKQWLKVVRKLSKEYSATLDQRRKDSLQRTIQYMESLCFTTDTSDCSAAKVYFISPTEIQDLECTYHTLYLTCGVAPSIRTKLFEHLAQLGVAVDYTGEMIKVRS